MDDLEEEDEDQECYVDVNATETKTFTAEAEGAAGLDSCCSRTLMGKKWLDSYMNIAPNFMKKDVVGPEKSDGKHIRIFMQKLSSESWA